MDRPMPDMQDLQVKQERQEGGEQDEKGMSSVDEILDESLMKDLRCQRVLVKSCVHWKK